MAMSISTCIKCANLYPVGISRNGDCSIALAHTNREKRFISGNRFYWSIDSLYSLVSFAFSTKTTPKRYVDKYLSCYLLLNSYHTK